MVHQIKALLLLLIIGEHIAAFLEAVICPAILGLVVLDARSERGRVALSKGPLRSVPARTGGYLHVRLRISCVVLVFYLLILGAVTLLNEG